MSNKLTSKHKLSNQPSEVIRQQYNEICFRLGQEIANERRAQDNQELLKDQQKETEAAFAIAKEREDEAAAKKANEEKVQAEKLATDAKAQAETALANGAGEATA